ncbi:LacI family DNA-binding transcriptional regulator [Amycolatopsis sp. NPDC051716]|uniref:LacI family DNA-binding transcriptional regulator n=1 Tax=Amycolatopsis sp. NPDC051716 TaxID=3155804 RepID=UPI003415C001
MKRPTVREIAARAGVSQGAVSYALNGRRGVSEATRNRVVEIARQLGWTPGGGTHRHVRRSGALGMVVHRPAAALAAEPFFGALLSGIQRQPATGAVSLVLQAAPSRSAELEIYRRWHRERTVGGVLLLDLRIGDTRPDELAEIGLPAVALGGPLGRSDVPSVWVDDRQAMTGVLAHLAGLGHRSVVRVAGPETFLRTRTRTDAFVAAAGRLGLADARTVYADYSDEGAAGTTRRVLKSKRSPTALVFDNDVIAVGGLVAAQGLGLRVPGDLSIVAWDDSVLCRLARPALTAVRRPIAECGALAVSVLRQVIDGGNAADTATSAPAFAIRGSTGPVARR